MSVAVTSERTIQVLATNYVTRQAFLADDLGRGFLGDILNAFDCAGEETDDLDEARALVIRIVIDGREAFVAYQVQETVAREAIA